MVKISVIIPTHSRPHLLPRAVQSARAAGDDVEVIVVDDASTDETASVCAGLRGIKYIRTERNQRTAGARNLGILASSADYLSFLDDDDVRLPSTLGVQIAALERDPAAGLVYGQMLIGDQDCQPTGQTWPDRIRSGDLFWDLLKGNFIPVMTAVFRKSCLFRVGLLNPDIAGIDDWDLWVRIAELYPILGIDAPLGIWRAATPDSVQGSSRDAALTALRIVHHQRLLSLPRALAATAKTRRAVRQQFLDQTSDRLIRNSAHWLPRGQKSFALANLLTALRFHPRRALRPFTLRLLARCFLARTP